jgi:hypothetical protein
MIRAPSNSSKALARGVVEMGLRVARRGRAATALPRRWGRAEKERDPAAEADMAAVAIGVFVWVVSGCALKEMNV